MRLGFLVSVSFFLVGADLAHAMYCGVNLVREGQSKFDVLQLCGQPAYTDSRITYRPVSSGFGPGPRGHQGGYDSLPNIIPVEVDEWVYNFGPTQLMPSLLFEGGQLVRIRLLGYGR